jgi:hypothetical protein
MIGGACHILMTGRGLAACVRRLKVPGGVLPFNGTLVEPDPHNVLVAILFGHFLAMNPAIEDALLICNERPALA